MPHLLKGTVEVALGILRIPNVSLWETAQKISGPSQEGLNGGGGGGGCL